MRCGFELEKRCGGCGSDQEGKRGLHAASEPRRLPLLHLLGVRMDRFARMELLACGRERHMITPWLRGSLKCHDCFCWHAEATDPNKLSPFSPVGDLLLCIQSSTSGSICLHRCFGRLRIRRPSVETSRDDGVFVEGAIQVNICSCSPS